MNHASFFAPKRRNMSDNIQSNTTGRLTPCLQQKIDKTRYLVEVHFSATSTQSVEDKLKRVILHDLEHGKQGRPRKSGGKWWIRPWQVATGYFILNSFFCRCDKVWKNAEMKNIRDYRRNVYGNMYKQRIFQATL